MNVFLSHVVFILWTLDVGFRSGLVVSPHRASQGVCCHCFTECSISLSVLGTLGMKLISSEHIVSQTYTKDLIGWFMVASCRVSVVIFKGVAFALKSIFYCSSSETISNEKISGNQNCAQPQSWVHVLFMSFLWTFWKPLM